MFLIFLILADLLAVIRVATNAVGGAATESPLSGSNCKGQQTAECLSSAASHDCWNVWSSVYMSFLQLAAYKSPCATGVIGEFQSNNAMAKKWRGNNLL